MIKEKDKWISKRLPAALVIAGVSWQKWIRFYMPVILVFSAIGVVTLVVAQMIQYTG